MSEPSKAPVTERLEALSARIYPQEDGTYRAWVAVSKRRADGSVVETQGASNPQKDWGEALAQALEKSGAVGP